MGLYSDYINAGLDFPKLTQERKNQLKNISGLRDDRAILVYASDYRKAQMADISITYEDLLPIKDQISTLTSDKIDVILETPGGFAEVAEDIVNLLRNKFNEVNFIIPGSAKSAGTIMAMSGDDILMEPSSSLGPIDAQIAWQGKRFSAEAFLKGLDKIKGEVDATGRLNKAYIPILQNISPGEIEDSQNALDFAIELVAEWLSKYKFKNWTVHSSTGQAVTTPEKKARAKEIADFLCRHSLWHTHGRSIKIDDLHNKRLKVIDYSKDAKLCEAIQRYFTLLQMTFENTNFYKIYETPTTQIYKSVVILSPVKVAPSAVSGKAVIEFICPKCKTHSKIQANINKPHPLEKGMHEFPKNDIFICPNCKAENDIKSMRLELEAQSKGKVV